MEDNIKFDLLLGMMIHFLYDKNIPVQPPRLMKSFKEFYKWIDTGVAWKYE
jgi:hypothetical protein